MRLATFLAVIMTFKVCVFDIHNNFNDRKICILNILIFTDVPGDNRGYLIEGTKYATIMAYTTFHHNTYIPYFSNPDVTYKGHPVGIKGKNHEF